LGKRPGACPQGLLVAKSKSVVVGDDLLQADGGFFKNPMLALAVI